MPGDGLDAKGDRRGLGHQPRAAVASGRCSRIAAPTARAPARASAATFDQIVNVAAQTIVDSTPNAEAKELLVATGVYLRNQNQAPVVNFVATPTVSRTVLLNASGSSDYEGRTLSMWWFKGTMPTSITCDQAGHHRQRGRSAPAVGRRPDR